jgi:putative membrane protein
MLMAVGCICAAPAAGAAPTGPAGTDRGAVAANKSDLTDAQILGVLDVANGGEAAQADLAIERTKTASVKELAQMMLDQHTQAKQKGNDIAKQLGVALAPSDKSEEVQKDGAKVVTKMQKASTDDFDRTYVKAQISEHEDTLKLIDGKLAPKATSPELKSFLKDLRASVEHHLSMAHGTLDDLAKNK